MYVCMPLICDVFILTRWGQHGEIWGQRENKTCAHPYKQEKTFIWLQYIHICGSTNCLGQSISGKSVIKAVIANHYCCSPRCFTALSFPSFMDIYIHTLVVCTCMYKYLRRKLRCFRLQLICHFLNTLQKHSSELTAHTIFVNRYARDSVEGVHFYSRQTLHHSIWETFLSGGIGEGSGRGP